jgi:hypothetical protein
MPLGRTGRREPFLNFEQRPEQDEPGVVCLGGQRDGFGRATRTDLCALGRVRGLEHEGPRHRGKRQVERHVDEDRQDEQPRVAHGADSNLRVPLTVSRSSRGCTPAQCSPWADRISGSSGANRHFSLLKARSGIGSEDLPVEHSGIDPQIDSGLLIEEIPLGSSYGPLMNLPAPAGRLLSRSENDDATQTRNPPARVEAALDTGAA